MQPPKVIHAKPSEEYYFEEGCYIVELSNHSKDSELSVARARVLPNTETKPHALKGTVERYIIEKGQGEVRLNSEIKKVVSAGDTVIIPEDCLQSIRNTGEEDLVFLVICTPRFKVENYREID